MALRSKLALWLVALFVVLATALAALQSELLDDLLIHQTTVRMRQSARGAWEALRARLGHLETVAALLAETLPPDAPLDESARRWRLDLLYRATPTSPGPLPSAPHGFARVPTGQLGRAGAAREGDSALVLFAAAPIPGRPGSTLVAGAILDGDQALVRQIARTLFPPTTWRGHPVGTVTLFRDAVRVATNVALPSGREALGTEASPEVTRQVLGRGEPWIGRAQVLGATYLSAYEPIRDPDGAVIGMLYVGELEEPLLEQKRRALLSGMLALGAILLAAFLANHLLARHLVGRLAGVKQATDRLAAGDAAARAPEDGADEIAALARAFNAMAAQLAGDRSVLVEQRDRLEAINRNYLETLGFVSHELRNGLGTALFNAAALDEGAYGALSGEQRQGLQLVRDSLDWLNHLLLNYLQLSRIEKGELLVKATPVALARDVVRPAAAGLEKAFASKGMPLVLAVPEDLDVIADPALLRVALENLLGNAYKYGRSGGRVEVTAVAAGEEVEVAVFNEGPGIAPERLARLFRKFERFDVAEPSGKRGTGLGLFIVRQILHSHGGEILAESEPGSWARFRFTLKRSRSSPAG